MPPSPKDSLQELRIISAQLGRDPELVQGAGGNTSIKSDGLLWIKGSGRWLADAEKADCFVPLELKPLLEAVQNGHEDPASLALCRELCPPGLRPSVETSLHAVMPQACVLHVHSVSAIAWGVHPQGCVLLSERLKGLPWHWISYVRPGLPLTAEVSRALERAPADVLVLANHGLVVAGESPRQALELLREVESRINIAPRPFPEADIERLKRLIEARPYRLPHDPRCHAPALDPESLRLVSGGTLYPDHLVFLGPGVRLLPDTPLDVEERAPLLLVPGRGMLLHGSLSPSAEAMALCLALVGQRLHKGVVPCYLEQEAERALLNWDAEAYRKSLNA